jgi:Ankyrin repeats (many copies)
MDDKFLPAQAAILSDNAKELERLVRADPSLATDRSLSTCDHPTLLCCLVLEMPTRRSLGRLIGLFSQFGAELNGPLVAAACVDNVLGVETLLDLGAVITEEGRWSPLEEALYWGHSSTVELLMQRGAPVDNLRKYAALGDIQGVRRCFDGDGRLSLQAGEVSWPFGATIPEEVCHDRRQIINNALVFAASWGQKEAAGELLTRGAEINAIPAGFDFAGTPLHYAALNNRREMADWLLERWADPAVRDTKVQNTPDGWAEYAHHSLLADYLRSIRERRAG